MKMRSRKQPGFTLIEILVSIVILGIGLLGAVQCIYAALESTMKAERLSLATAIAQNVIEEVRSTGVATTQTTALHESLFPGGGESTITVTPFGDSKLSLRRVTVGIAWQEQGRLSTKLQLETVITNRTRHIGG